MLSAAYDGQKVDVRPSMNYALYRWRKEMRVGYDEMRRTPLDVIMTDLEYISIERSVSAEKAKRRYGKSGK